MTQLDIPDPDAAIRRDQWQRYLIVPPAGGTPTGYTRATTVAKTLDGEGGLLPWKATMAMTGMLRRPGLRARFEALMAKHPERGPWYGSAAAKAECKALVEECAEAGGSSDRADIGTALHSIIEQLNKGETPQLAQDVTQADIDAYTTTVAASGIVIDPEYCEATIVVDRFKVAGMSDMLRVTVPDVGDVVGDLKTGETLEWSWGPMCVQLAIYAHGDNVYRQGPNPDGSDDQRLPMPPVSLERGLIVHLPAGSATCTLHWVDLVAGWDAFERSMWARDWRTRKDLHALYTPPATPPEQFEGEPKEQWRTDLDAETATPPRRPRPKLVPPPPLPDEGAAVDPAAVEAMRKAYERLDNDSTAWATGIMVQGNDAALPWNKLSNHPTVRRWELYRGVGALARWAHPDSSSARATLDDIVRAIVTDITGDISAQFPTNPPGLLLAALDHEQAAHFARIAHAVANDDYTLDYDDNGLLTLVEAET